MNADPTTRKIPADELYQAVELLRSVVDVADAARERNQWEHWNEPHQLVHPQALRDVLAEFDRRGAAIERVREAAEKIERAESLGATRVLGARIRDVLAELDG